MGGASESDYEKTLCSEQGSARFSWETYKHLPLWYLFTDDAQPFKEMVFFQQNNTLYILFSIIHKLSEEHDNCCVKQMRCKNSSYSMASAGWFSTTK